MSRIRVLLVEDSDALLGAVAAWLAQESRIEVVGTAGSSRDAVEQAERLRPDLVLMDVTLSEMSGFGVTGRIKSRPNPPLVVLMTFFDSEAARNEAWSVGADGVVSKMNVTEDLLPLVRSLVADSPGEVAHGARPGEHPTASKQELSTQKSTKRVPPGTLDP